MEDNKNLKGSINKIAIYHTDAYAIAVAKGFEGTVEEWLAYLSHEEEERARAASESARVEAESKRVDAENARVAAERKRVEAENARVAADEGREEIIGVMIDKAIENALIGALDIANDLETDNPAKALSAAQGVVLKGLVDALGENMTQMETGWFNGVNDSDTGSTPCPIVFPFAPKAVFIIQRGVAFTAYYENPGCYWTTKLIVLFPDLNCGVWIYYNNEIGASGNSGNTTISNIHTVNKSEDGKTINMPVGAKLYTSITSRVLATEDSGYGNYYVAFG